MDAPGAPVVEADRDGSHHGCGGRNIPSGEVTQALGVRDRPGGRVFGELLLLLLFGTLRHDVALGKLDGNDGEFDPSRL